MSDKKVALTVYFDGSCPLCRAEISHYRAQIGADEICFRDVSKDDLTAEPDLSTESAMSRLHVRLSDGRLVSGALGFVEIWKTLPRWHRVARIASLPGVVSMMEVAYRLFLPIRPFLSKVFARLNS